jgi:hypothetical protein
MKRRLLGAGVVGALGVALALPAGAQIVGSDIPTAIVTFPVVRVEDGIDTFIQMANTNESEVRAAQCFYVNGYGTCSVNTGESCLVNFDCPDVLGGEQCVPNWVTVNFFIDFTPFQPLGWQASDGLADLPCAGQACGLGGDTNAIQATVPDVSPPFRGFLTCVAIASVDDNNPIDANDFIGTGTVITAAPLPLNSYTYNAVGIESNENAGGDNHLCLGEAEGSNCEEAEYSACPQTLILNHFFDNSQPIADTTVTTRLVLIPCTQLEAPRPDRPTNDPDVVPTVAQFLIFNEFEQKTSTSTRAVCYTDLQLSDIDTRASYTPDDTTSVFNIAVQGTIGGQTRIRGVATLEPDGGHGLLGVAVQTLGADGTPPSSAAVNLNFQGQRGQPDVICLAQGACEPTEGP